MKLPLWIIVIVVVAILLISSGAYVIYIYDWDDDKKKNKNNGNGNNSSAIDDEPPIITVFTRDATGTQGDTITILVTFNDNVAVTKATLYYQTEDSIEWTSRSILSKSYDISLISLKNVYYYVTVDDAAGNGPVGDPSNDGSEFYTITVIEGNNGNAEYISKVFIEESTATTCKYCTNVAEVLHELFDPEDPEFYYVSLVEDENEVAYDRVANHYHRFANPTVYIDGGYEVLYGFKEDTFKVDFKQKVQNSLLRDAPDLIVDIQAEWNETRKELTNTVTIENNDTATYNGELKIFISEIKSTRWNDYNGDPFHYAFLEYILEQNINIEPDQSKEFSKIWNASKSKYSNVVPENLMVYAVVFNSEKNQGYSRPPDKDPFDAYYSDAAEATQVQEGSLPPTIGINSPKKGYRYYLGRLEKMPPLRAILVYFMRQWRNGTTPLLNATTLMGDTVLFGKNIINVSVDAPAGVKTVEFYVDDELQYNTSEEPYQWNIKKIGKRQVLRKHTILVKVIDTQERSAEDSLDIFTFFL
jgi:glutaredoxin